MKKVGEISHYNSGIKVPFHLVGTRFTCVCLEKTFTAPDATILQAQVLDFIEHWLQLDWHPIISVEIERESGYGRNTSRGIILDYERFYVSRSPAGKVLRVDWDVEPMHRRASLSEVRNSTMVLTALPLGAPLKYDSDETWLDYSEAAWTALRDISAGIEKLADMVIALVTTSKGNAKLEMAAVKPLLQLVEGQ